MTDLQTLVRQTSNPSILKMQQRLHEEVLVLGKQALEWKATCEALQLALETERSAANMYAKQVAHRFAHPLALELECVLADRNANWDRAMNLIGEYRSAMNAIHEQHSPTFMGEPLL